MRFFPAMLVFLGACSSEPTLFVDLGRLQNTAGGDNIDLERVSIEVWANDLAPIVVDTAPSGIVEIPVTEGTDRKVRLIAYAPADGDATAFVEEMAWYWGMTEVDVIGKSTQAIVNVEPAGMLRVTVESPDVPFPDDVTLSLLADAQVPVVGTVQPFEIDETGVGLMALPTRNYGITVSTDAAVELPGELVASVDKGEVTDVTAYLLTPDTKCQAGRPDEVLALDPPCRTLNVSVSGLLGSGLAVVSGTGERIEVPTDGTYTFPSGLLDGQSYLVTVADQPAGPTQVCSTIGANGVVNGEDALVTVQCTTTSYQLFADVQNLKGSGFRLASGTVIAPIPTPGVHQIRSDLIEGDPVELSVNQLPTAPDQECTIDLPETTMGTADITALVACKTPVQLSGTVAGLTGSGLVLSSGGEDLPVSTQGTFTFATTWYDGDTYDVQVTAQPTGPTQTCTVQAGSGTFAHDDVSSVYVTCITDEYSLEAEVTGLEGTMVLRSDPAQLSVNQDGVYTLRTDLIEGDPVTLEVVSVPNDPVHDCTVSLPQSTVGQADIRATVSCRREYTVGGTVSGLTGTGLVLENNAESLPIATDGAYLFTAPVLDGEGYAVTVTTQPSGPRQQCTVQNGTGLAAADVTNADVTCITEAYDVEVVVTGLDGSLTVSNGADTFDISSDGTYAFPTQVDDQQSYAVTLDASPASQRCTLSDASGTLDGATVQATIDCVDLYDVEVTIAGLSGTLSLSLNGDTAVDFTTDGQQALGGPLEATEDYAVTVADEQVGTDTCTVLAPSGSYTGAETVVVEVICLSQPILTTDRWNQWVRTAGVGDCQTTDTRDACTLLSGEASLLVPGVSSCSEVLGVGDSQGALDWACEEQAGVVTVASSGLTEGARLIDLLDPDTDDWAETSVVIDLDRGTVSTLPQIWWSNPVISHPGGTQTYSTADAVVLVEGLLTGHVTLQADGMSVTTAPGATLQGVGLPTVTVENADFTWIEGQFDNTDAHPVVLIGGVQESYWTTVRGATITGGTTGIAYDLSVRGLFTDTLVENVSGEGIAVQETATFRPNGNWFVNLTVVRNDAAGIRIGGYENLFVDSVSANNGSHGVHIDNRSGARPHSNTLQRMRIYGNSGDGVFFDNANNTSIARSIIVGNDGAAMTAINAYGSLLVANTLGDGTGDVTLDFGTVSQYNTLHDSVLVSETQGIRLTSSSNTWQMRDLVVLDQDTTAIDISNSSGIVWDGLLTLFDDTDCSVGVTGDAGLFEDCTLAGSSTATVTFASDTLADSFLGAVSDSQNPDGASGIAAWSSSLSLDTFETPWRTWAPSGAVFDPATRGACISGLCQVRDWSVDASDPWLFDKAGAYPPAGTESFTHRWFVINATSQADCTAELPGTTYNSSGGTCDAIALHGAVEIDRDGVGNDNALCESGEDCLWLQHIGAWQGDGALTGPDALSSAGSVASIDLYTY